MCACTSGTLHRSRVLAIQDRTEFVALILPFFAPCFVGQDTRGMSTLRTPPTGQRSRKKHAPSDEPSGKAPRRPIWHPCAAEMWPAASGVCCHAGRRYAVILMKLISQEAPAQCSRFEGLITGVLHLLLHNPSFLPITSSGLAMYCTLDMDMDMEYTTRARLRWRKTREGQSRLRRASVTGPGWCECNPLSPPEWRVSGSRSCLF